MDNDQEQVSALMDGELPGAEASHVLGHLLCDTARIRLWERYHLMGDAMRANLPDRIDLRFAERVWQALDREPMILIPRAVRRRLHRGLRHVAIVAIAASVAVVAVLGVSLLSQRLIQPGTTELASVVGPGASRFRTQHRLPGGQPARSPSPVQDPKLQGYSVNHYEYASSNGMLGILPYVSFVGNEARD
jgi:sigma-E factor negative regulatory protein RseA